MPAFVIQTDADPFYTLSPTLDGVEYTLRFNYNQRENNYYLSIEDPETVTDILSCIKIVNNFPLLNAWKGLPGTPPGDFVALSNSTADDSSAGLGDMAPGGRVTLYYMDAQFLATGT